MGLQRVVPENLVHRYECTAGQMMAVLLYMGAMNKDSECSEPLFQGMVGI